MSRNVINAAHASALRALSTAANLAFGILATRLLGEDAFGSYVSIFAVAGLLSVVTTGGLPTLLQRELSHGRGNGDFSMVTPLVQWLVLLNFLLVLSILALSFLTPTYVQLVLIFIVASNLIGAAGAVFMGFERVLIASWIGNVVRPLGAVAALFALYFLVEPSPNQLLLSQVVGCIFAMVCFIYFWKKPVVRPLFYALRSDWWSGLHLNLIRAGALISGTQLVINFKTQVEILLLTMFADAADVAYFYAASRAALVVAFFPTATYLMAEPRLTRLLASQNEAEVREEVRSASRIGFFGTVLAAACAILLAPYYLQLYGEGFETALVTMYVLILSLVLRSAFGPALPMLRAGRQDYPVLKITILSLCITLPVSLVLIQTYGILGAAIGSLIHSTLNEWWLARTARVKTGFQTHLFS